MVSCNYPYYAVVVPLASLFLILLAKKIAAQEHELGTNFTAVGRIIGGTDAPFGSYPWFAVTRTRGECGGMLVAKEWVLTAAHCMVDEIFHAVEIGAVCQDAFGFSNGNCEQKSQVISVRKTFIHPEYIDNGITLEKDFALVRLSTAATDVNPVDMDLDGLVDSYNSNTPLWAIGFGDIDPDSYYQEFPTRLQHVQVNFVPQTSCNDEYDGDISDNMMCAGVTGKDACDGDSGGPLYDAVNKVVVGVTSWGEGCAIYPGVYAKIFAQRDWIINTICSDSTILPSFCNDLPTSPSLSPTVTLSPTVQCYDYPYWIDLMNDECSWYAAGEDRCENDGDQIGLNNVTANEACCVCGGGTTDPPPKCENVPNWVDDYGDGCDWYEQGIFSCEYYGASYAGSNGLTANGACCVCGGGIKPCTDEPNFTFSTDEGKQKRCDWLARVPSMEKERKNKYCLKAEVRNGCKETCGFCDSCFDIPDFTFELDNGKTQDCTWFDRNPNKAEERKLRYCGHPDVRSGCQETCGLCINSCSDIPNFTFELDNGNTQDCEWFNRNENAADARKDRYCKHPQISSGCEETCGTCVNSASPSISPTRSLSPTVACYNWPPSWFDVLGHGCSWYEADTSRCPNTYYYYDGNATSWDLGLTANEVCCVCGGGTNIPPPTCEDTSPDWTDAFGDGCDWYAAASSRCDGGGDAGPNGETAKEACCVCGGGNKACDDDANFTFELEIGKYQDCAWLTKNSGKADARVGKYCEKDDVKRFCYKTCSTCSL